MPINVAYGPDAKLLGLAALMAGKGQKSERDEELALQLAERERERKAALARQLIGSVRTGGGGGGGQPRQGERFHPFGLDVEPSPEAPAATPRQGGGSSRQQLIEQALIEQGLTPTQLLQAQQAERMGQDLQADQEYQTYLREQKLIDRAPNLTDKEKLEAHRIHELQYAGIQKPGDVLDEPPQFPEGQNIGETWTDEQGNTLTRDASGIPKVLSKGAGADVDIDKLYQQAVNELGEDADPKAIEERIIEIHERKQRIRQRLGGGGPQEPGVPSYPPGVGPEAKYGFTAAEAKTPDDLIALGTAQPSENELDVGTDNLSPDTLKAGNEPQPEATPSASRPQTREEAQPLIDAAKTVEELENALTADDYDRIAKRMDMLAAAKAEDPPDAGKIAAAKKLLDDALRAAGVVKGTTWNPAIKPKKPPKNYPMTQPGPLRSM